MINMRNANDNSSTTLMPLCIQVFLCVWVVMTMPASYADGHIRGGCVIGESAIAHSRTNPEAVMDIRRYAQLYVSNFQKFRKTERGLRSKINELLALEQWAQADVIAFTKQQRELLYLSVGSQLATGRITADELPEYAALIRQKIADIEIELGCDVLPGS